MQQIIYDGRKIKVYEALKDWCNMVKKDEEFLFQFWKRMLNNEEVYKEIT